MNYTILIIILIILAIAVTWLFTQLSTTKSKLSEQQQKTKDSSDQYDILAEELKNRDANIKLKTDEITSLKIEKATLQTEIHSCNKAVEEYKRQEEKNEERLKTIFENIASDILEKKSDKFSKESDTHIKNLLEPFEKDISSFKKRIEDTFIEQTKDKATLSSELKQLMQLNQQLSNEANNLTKALKGEKNNKMQGDWGEMILETILSNSGLEHGVHYFTQESGKNDEGKTIRPDVIVRYPDGSEIIIDSKVSLVAYSRYMETDEETTRTIALKEHITSIKRHIDELSNKKYESRERSLDFVMMFMPIEPAYMLALSSDNTLWQYAYSRKILLISPTHLITALKLIHDLWSRDAQTKNTIDIAEQGAKLYDKFVNFVEDMNKIGSNLERTSNSYNNAMKKLQDGSGNLIRQTQKLKELGIKTKKQLELKDSGEE